MVRTPPAKVPSGRSNPARLDSASRSTSPEPQIPSGGQVADLQNGAACEAATHLELGRPVLEGGPPGSRPLLSGPLSSVVPRPREPSRRQGEGRASQRHLPSSEGHT